MSQSLLSLNDVLPPERLILFHLFPTSIAEDDCSQLSLFFALRNGSLLTPRPIALASFLSMKGLTIRYRVDLNIFGLNNFPIQINPSPVFD